MRALCVAVLGVAMAMCAGTARAQDDNGKKIVGVWEVTKSASMIPIGSTLEFTKDNKLTLIIKDGASETKYDGTYKIEKEKLSVKISLDGQTNEETVTVKKLTDDALEVEDKDKKVDVFKKKK
jgi:uncharacterized protein (TIGR03066 family)